MTISLVEWGQLRDAGATTYSVGPLPGRCAVYTDRSQAEAAADQVDGTFIQWHGRQLATAERQAELQPEPEAGQ